MFEKDFEFEVTLSIDMCEERIERLGNVGCIQWLFTAPTKTRLLASKRGVYTQFTIQSGSGRRGVVVEIDGTLEAMSSQITLVTGVARIQKTRIWLFVLFLLCVAITLSIIYYETWLTTAFLIVMFVLQYAVLISDRDKIIRKLENALMIGVKKKKRARHST